MHRRHNSQFRALSAFAGAIAVSGLDAAVVWGCAGGGESYGGGSGGGGGGEGGGFRWLVYLLVRLVVEYPAVGVPLIIIVIGIALYAGSLTAQWLRVTHDSSRRSAAGAKRTGGSPGPAPVSRSAI